MAQPPIQPFQPPMPPTKPKRSWGKRALIWVGGVLAALIVIGAIGDATGANKKTDTASTTAPAVTPPPVATSGHKSAVAPPANGGSYPNAAAILAKLAAAGLTCPGASPQSSASVFYPGATSMDWCNSPGGSAQDTGAGVFDTSAHTQQFKSDISTNPVDATGIVVGVNWAVNSTNVTYMQKVRALLGGQLSFAAASTASAATTSAPTAAQQAYAGQMSAAGFFTGTPSWIIDADGNAVCGALQSESMSAEIAYEESVDENTLTGMTTKSDILTFIRASVTVWCPQYESELPAQ